MFCVQGKFSIHGSSEQCFRQIFRNLIWRVNDLKRLKEETQRANCSSYLIFSSENWILPILSVTWEAEIHPDIMHIRQILVLFSLFSTFRMSPITHIKAEMQIVACVNLHLSSITKQRKTKPFKKQYPPPLRFSNRADSNGNVRWRTFPPAGGLFNLEFSKATSA